jgi:hypothetical protein
MTLLLAIHIRYKILYASSREECTLGINKKFLAIGAKECPLAAMAVQYCKPLVTFEIGGMLSYSSTTSPIYTALKASKLSKHLFCDNEAYKDLK